MSKLWHNLFLVERPSISLSFFRIAVAITVGAIVFPPIFQISENFYATAFKTHNGNFFPVWFLELVFRSPDWVVSIFTALFCFFWFFFLIGLWSQLSCIVVMLCCYYFYALNAFTFSMLSWDILLVTLFMMCLIPYHGDYFSVDALKRGDAFAYARLRPYFMQRLLQLQIALTYFYTALHKVTGAGNWFTDNPLYYVMNSPPEGTTKYFILRDYLRHQPELCYWLGVFVVVVEFLMIFLLFWRKTRVSAIYLGFVFHITLLLTLDVPSVFLLLFPPQLLLFINPDDIVAWINRKRLLNENNPRQPILLYDGNCQFCQASLRQLKVMDLFSTIKGVDYHGVADLKTLAGITPEQAHSQIHLVESDGKVYGGFEAFRRLCLKFPMLYPVTLFVYLPGMGLIGPWLYRWIAKNRYFFHRSKTCTSNSCFR